MLDLFLGTDNGYILLVATLAELDGRAGSQLRASF